MNQSQPLRSLFVSTVFKQDDTPARIGSEAYSYPFVAKAFLPLLAQLGSTELVTRPESRLDFAVDQSRIRGEIPLHLSFMPLHATYLTAQTATACFPFWEYPEIPSLMVGNNPRSNWVHMANCVDLLLTACHFTRSAFERAGVHTPIHIVPVPVRGDYFSLPSWTLRDRVKIDCPCYWVTGDTAPVTTVVQPWLPQSERTFNPRSFMRALYLGTIRPRMPRRLDVALTLASRGARKFAKAYRHETRVNCPESSSLELSGTVFTTILNPFDARKNLDDLLSAFLLAFKECEDATLVVKLAMPPALKIPELNRILQDVREMGISARCRIVFIADYLTDEQMLDLTRASTFYVTSTRAEGACLPLQDFLAAGRPAIAPIHTSLRDYFDAEVGFPIDSHPEPTWWPTDPAKRLLTTWHRPVWQSLFDQLQSAYRLVREQPARYVDLSQAARARLLSYASAAAVRPRLQSALDELARLSASTKPAGPAPVRASAA